MSKVFHRRAIACVALGFVPLFSCAGGDTRDRGAEDGASGLTGINPSEGSSTGGGIDDGDTASEGVTHGDPRLDLDNTPTEGACGSVDLGCTDQIDLLFVIDNSGTMAVEQENLARNFPLLIRQLEQLEDRLGNPVKADVQVMVTTTDFDHPACRMYQHEDYEPARGAPISTTCLDREPRFTGLERQNPTVAFDACTNVCDNREAAPAGDPFIAFSDAGDNIPDTIVPTDVDGDGVDDSPAAQALACIGPQGIDGCGYESQLESMLQALNPGKSWNQGDRPFLREDALLAIVIITDEADCSISDHEAVMTNTEFQEINPASGNPVATSAVCWNAGVSCDGPDASGVYTNCTSTEDNGMHPTSRYTNYLIRNLREDQHKEVIMLGILGVPPVTAHNPNPPYEPIEGGVRDLVYREWLDGEYPAGDILPAEFAAGIAAEDKTFEFGIGPGCTGGDVANGFTGQAIPATRVQEVCESLNIVHDDGTVDVRCCIESICDSDYSVALKCLTGIIQETIVAPG